MALVTVRPYAGTVISRTSPVRPDVELEFKSAGVAETIARQNLSSKVRYVSGQNDNELVSERDFPMGDLQLETIFLALHDWNLGDENGRKLEITKSNVKRYLTPREYNWAYEVALEANPAWKNGGEVDEKND